SARGMMSPPALRATAFMDSISSQTKCNTFSVRRGHGEARLRRPKVQRTLVVFPIRPGLGHGQGARALLLVEAPPRRRRPARGERAGDPGVVLDRVARGARGHLFARTACGLHARWPSRR